MRLYLIRHGESEANIKKLHNSPNVKLTKAGLKQAVEVAKRLEGIKIDFIYSSSQSRALQTAEVVSKTLKIPIETWDKIIEVKTPSINWGKPVNDRAAAKIDKLASAYTKPNWKHSDEETFEEIRARALIVLNHLLKKHKNQNILCISHTSFIKALVLTAIVGNKLPSNLYVKFRENAMISNLGITSLIYDQKRGWVLETWNDISHL